MATQAELIKQWKAAAEYAEQQVSDQGNYLSDTQRIRLEAKADAYRECASDLEALTY